MCSAVIGITIGECATTKIVKTYIINADIVRVFALFAVVGIHLLNPIYARPDFFGGTFWWVAFLLNCLFRMSVPLFVMLSGYLVLGKPTDISTNLKRTWNRVVVPLLSFYLIWYVYRAIAAYLRGSEFNYWSLVDALSKNTYSYLYFLVILAFLYALIPLFQLVFNDKDKELPKYLITFFFLNAVVAMIARYFSLRVGDVFNTYTTWVLWIGYFLLGYWVRLHTEVLKSYWSKLGGMFVLGFGLTVGLGYWSLAQHIQGNDILYIGGVSYPEEYLSLGVVLMAVSAFVLLMTVQVPSWFSGNPRLVGFPKWLAMVSFGVYLVHPMVIDALNKFFGITADNPAMPNLVVYVLLNTFLTVVISTGISAVLNKTMGLRRIVGRVTT